jgi:hypothetical protein
VSVSGYRLQQDALYSGRRFGVCQLILCDDTHYLEVQTRSLGQHVPRMPSFLSEELGELFVRVLVGRTLLMLERYAHIGNAPFCLYTYASTTDSVTVVAFHRELITIRTI